MYSQFILVRLFRLVVAFDTVNLAVHDVLETIGSRTVLIEFQGIPFARVRLSVLS